jgi:hypothetical protein|uniref:Uncharacterized protein n=1 Tax=uncultured bacterium A1Q1_fos_2116 TaxID=1256564 RepID=L7VRY3_9BACT|nr:hypothetical protein [uncultured bacterium A1Q1_fos_2116]
MTNSSVPTTDPIRETTDVLVRALRALGNAGQPDTASRLAARAWWVLKSQHPREAERLNGVLHYLARLPEQVDSASNE